MKLFYMFIILGVFGNLILIYKQHIENKINKIFKKNFSNKYGDGPAKDFNCAKCDVSNDGICCDGVKMKNLSPIH